MHFTNQTAFQLWLLLLICVSWVIASDENTVNLQIGFDFLQGKDGPPSLRVHKFDARPDDSVNPHAKHSEYRRLIRAESSSDVGSSVDEKDEKDDKIKKVVKIVGGPVEKAVEKSSDSSSDSSDSDIGNAAIGIGKDDGKSTQGIKREDFEPEGSGERRKKRAVKFHRPIRPNAALEE